MQRIIRITGPQLLLALGGLALLLGAAALAVGLWPSRATALRSPPKAPCTPQAPCLAVVIDDVGRDLGLLEQLLESGAELTYAVLPHASATGASIAALQRHGREYLLHLPLEPLDRRQISDEPIVLGTTGPLAQELASCLATVPGAVGVNNHMGSALSQDEAALRELLGGLRQQRLWVLDSRTTPKSVICQVAFDLGLACRQRDVFLDHPAQADMIAARWREAVQIARQRGWAIAIAHLEETSTAHLLKTLKSPGIRLRRLSALYQGRFRGPDAT